MTDLAPEPLDALGQLVAAITSLADYIEHDCRNLCLADELRAIIPKPRRGDG